MIQVDRGPEPDSFATHSADWERRFAEAQNQTPELTPGKFWSRVRREIRPYAQALDLAFYGKCAFCESKPAHVSSPHIEHYRPKSKFPDKMFVWQNWLLSCGRCNEKKWTHFPDCDGQPCLLNPTSEDPGEHLDFLGAKILHKTSRGKKTIDLIKLDRSPLAEERARWLTYINILLVLVCRVPEVHTETRELLIWSMQPDAPYAAMTRVYLRRKVPRLANPNTPHPFIKPREQVKRIAELVAQYSDQLQMLE